MGFGAIVDAEDFRPWLHDARINGEIEDFYWSRYRKLLNLKGLPKSVIDATDEVMDRVLDRLGDPHNLSPWSRRGMVVGHVQSGKTANYTGLICKAADAGYRLRASTTTCATRPRPASTRASSAEIPVDWPMPTGRSARRSSASASSISASFRSLSPTLCATSTRRRPPRTPARSGSTTCPSCW
jgi:hypothetical protein